MAVSWGADVRFAMCMKLTRRGDVPSMGLPFSRRSVVCHPMPRAIVLVTLSAGLLLTACNQREGAQNPEIQVEVERLHASKARSPQDVQPYDEALAWHEYRVRRVLSGRLDAKIIRVAHWTVLAAKAVPVSARTGEVTTLTVVPFESLKELKDIAASDDLDVVATEPPRFLDLSQSVSTATTPGAVRYDYRGNVSEQMQLYWKLRGQLRAVAMGNSHATKGVNPRAIMDNDNWGTPLMLNMAPAGANLDQQSLMLREYVLPLPKLEWLLWVVSARSFNAERKDTRKYEEFTASPGWLHDQKHKRELWPVPETGKLVTSTELEEMRDWTLDIWGANILAKSMLPEGLDRQRAAVLGECDSTRFSWGADLFAGFCETARLFPARGVKVLVFTTPIHPFIKEADASDPDGTTHEGYREMVRHMEEFDRTTPGLWFRDFNKDGGHGFPTEEFYDVDHLNRAGTHRLGDAIRAWMKECATDPR